MQFLIAINILFKRLKAIRFLFKDKSVPRRKKALVVAGIVYLFLPVDLIPPVLFPISWVDDLILWIWILWYLRDFLDKYWMGGTRAPSADYSDKTVIEGVDYEIKEDAKEASDQG